MLDQPPLDYVVVAFTGFTHTTELTAVATLHYAGATTRAPSPLPLAPQHVTILAIHKNYSHKL
jgi:hypothetical protein